jgi:hypothetical protein
LAKGEFPHWWLVIRDALENGDSQLVFEGKVETDENVIEILDRHECLRYCGVADSGDDTTHVYQFCLKYGIHAIKGGKEAFYSHPDKSKKIYSVERPLHAMLNAPPKFEYQWQVVAEYSDAGIPNYVSKLLPVKAEPKFWLYSKARDSRSADVAEGSSGVLNSKSRAMSARPTRSTWSQRNWKKKGHHGAHHFRLRAALQPE